MIVSKICFMKIYNGHCTSDLIVSNPLFTKRESHLVTYQSGENQSQIDYILVKRQNIKLVRDVKVIPNEECVTQHKILACDTRIVKREDRCKKFVADISNKFCETFTGKIMISQVSK